MSSRSSPSRALHLSLWVVQVLLAVAFGLFGVPKVFQPLEELARSIPWVGSSPAALVRFVGVAEVLGAVGLVLPAALRIKPGLTPLAALGLLVIMVLAAGLHLVQGEFLGLPINLVLGGLAAFVVWGRLKKAVVEETEPARAVAAERQPSGASSQKSGGGAR